jgi:alanine racemase
MGQGEAFLTGVQPNATVGPGAGQTTLLDCDTPPSSPRETALREGLRVWAEVDLDRLAANVRALKQAAGEAHLLAVVKGNAYGHGAVPVASTALANGAWGAGVIGVEEGAELRMAGFAGPIVVLGSAPPSAAATIVDLDLRPTVASLEMGVALSDAAVRAGSEVAVHVKVETGLNRFGVVPDEAVALAESLRGLPNLTVEGLSTHLASVDEGDKTFTYQQYELFRSCAERLPWVPMHHISSTGGLLDLPDLRLAMVRTGIGLYGYYPSEEVSHSVPLQPVLSLRSRVARVATVMPGESVGYSRTWTATQPARIATVMAGYADGIRRSLSNRGVALVRGCRAQLVGRVAMDMHMIDVSEIPGVQADDEVTLIGEQGGETLSADEVASRAGTISYEILAGIMHRVPRLYIRDGCIAGRHDFAGYHGP